LKKRNSPPRPEYLFSFEHVLHILIILDRFVMEYCTCERGKLLSLVHLVLCIALTVYLHSVTPPIFLYNPRLLGGVEAKGGWVVHQEHDKAGDGVDPTFEMVSSPNVPGAVIKDMGPGFWRVLRSVQVLWRLVRKEPQAELSYRGVFGGGADQAATQTRTMTDRDPVI
jgi:hypothetical protein